MNQFKHKVISVVIVVVATYFSFQALDLISGIYQMNIYFTASWYVFLFHIFWLTFIFDLHLKRTGHLAHARERFTGARVFWHAFKDRVRHLYHWSYLRHYVNYLILPSIIYWSVVILMYLNPFFELFKDGLIVLTTAALTVAYWYFKEAFNHHMELKHVGLKVLGLVKLYGAFLAYTALIAVGWYYNLSLSILMPAVFIISFLLIYQTLFQRRQLRVDTYPLILIFATVMTLVYTIIFKTWLVNYYTAGLMLVVIYNTFWSLLHHHLDRTLTQKLLWEYVFMLIVLASLILASQTHQGRILDS